MSAAKFLAFDFGAESGRVILGRLDRSKIRLEEIHRFPNRQIKVFDHIYWDIHYLFDELKQGLMKTGNLGHKNLSGIGVDTWGVDFGFLGKGNQLLGNPYCYRDSRTKGMMERAFNLMSKDEIYKYTGIQFMQLNSIFQLLSIVETQSISLSVIEKLLFMPDLFNFFMTGEKLSEYSIASTSQLLNAKDKTWEPAIFEKLNLPIKIMAPVIQPGSVIAKILPEITEETGIQAVDVIAPACHDTASAVAAVPAQLSNWAYLSSGTWSLVGIEVKTPIINENSLKHNFTNEGGINQTIRFLRNTMGLWLLQKCSLSWRQNGEELTYAEITNMAKKATPFKCIVNPDDLTFLNPPDMPTAILDFCKKTNQPYPESKGEFARCIFESLALKYRYILELINSMRGETIEVLHIVGGGSQNELLNQFTANSTGLEVIAGPIEATALGNIIVQAIAKKELGSLQEGRGLVANSFTLKRYEPEKQELWNDIYQKSISLFSD